MKQITTRTREIVSIGFIGTKATVHTRLYSTLTLAHLHFNEHPLAHTLPISFYPPQSNDVHRMAIDYIIGALQLVSAAVNILALGSFWITPGLRTTANRFVINLLIVNIVGCIALTPALWLHGGLIPTVHSEIEPMHNDDNGHSNSSTLLAMQGSAGEDVFVVPATDATVVEPLVIGLGDRSKDGLGGSGVGQGIDDTSEIIADVQANNGHNISLLGDINNYNNNNNNRTWSPTKNIRYSDCTRFWGFDLVAALGKQTNKIFLTQKMTTNPTTTKKSANFPLHQKCEYVSCMCVHVSRSVCELFCDHFFVIAEVVVAVNKYCVSSV